MKAILLILLILLICQGFVQGTDLYPIMPIEPYLINTLLQNGSTPYLQKGIPEEEWKVHKINLMEELEQKLIEVRLIQQSA